MRRKLFICCLLVLLFPYVITLSFTGRVEGKEKPIDLFSGRRVILDRGTGQRYMDVEEYLPGVVAKQMPADFGEEALKAQAMIARTYIYKQMGGEQEILESQLQLEYLEEAQLKALWGTDDFVTYYTRVEQATQATMGMVITYEGNYIDPLFHRASTGKTRRGDETHPYLESVDSSVDVKADGYLTSVTFTKEEFVQRISQIRQGVELHVDQIPSTIQVIEKDENGYILNIQIGNETYTGEMVQSALSLSSSNFILEEYNGQIRAISSGIGHGYGFSQYGAKEKSQEGWSAEEILSYFYKNIMIISE